MSYKPSASVVEVTSRKGRKFINIKIVCGERAILFAPKYADDLLDELETAADEAEELIAEREEHVDDE